MRGGVCRRLEIQLVSSDIPLAMRGSGGRSIRLAAAGEAGLAAISSQLNLAISRGNGRGERYDRRMLKDLLRCAVLVGVASLLAPEGRAEKRYALETVAGLRGVDVALEAVVYQGQKAVRVLPKVAASEEQAALKNDEGGGIAVVVGSSFHNGTIEVDVTGKPREGAAPAARGFVGIAFRVASDDARYECFYVRPMNGRAEDQVRRNHSTQYISMPEYQWSRLRKEAPERYESYVDIAPGEWTKLRIEVSGVKARLYVNGSKQPVLVVSDLKHGDSEGGLALWIGLGSEAYFANLRVVE